MKKESQNFLWDLLNTHSPSGAEEKYQKIWLDYVSKFAEVDTDNAGNAIGIINPDAKFKVLLSGHGDEIAMVVNKVDDKGFVYFSKVGGINNDLLPGLRVEILGYGGIVKGVIGFAKKADKTSTLSIDTSELFIDCGFESGELLRKLIRTGDYILYHGNPELIRDDILVSKALDNKTGSFIVAETLRYISQKNINVACYAVSSTGEETNMRGAHFAAAAIEPDMAIAVDVTFEKTPPGENKRNHPDVLLGRGPAISTGSPINPKIVKLIEKTAKTKKIGLQYELTPARTFTDCDKIMFSGKGVPVALVSLPIRYMHSPIEMCSLKDIDSIIKLLAETIISLTGKENLRPIEYRQQK